MELFSELYSLYYHAVNKALQKAAEHPLSGGELQKILSEGSFSESAYFILPKLMGGDWPLLREKDQQYLAVCVPPDAGLTSLQRSWLKALLSDPRFSLFFSDEEIEKFDAELSDIAPLFLPEDFHTFDSAADGDNYANETYRKHFKLFLRAIRDKSPLQVEYEGGKGQRVSGVFFPYRLEYSRKDDKLRAFCYRNTIRGGRQYTLNIGRVSSAGEADVEHAPQKLSNDAPEASFREVVLEITHERNALERCMVHFAHFEKRTEYDEKADRYTCTIKYSVMDESEVVIRVLSFGPTVRVLGPEMFVAEIRRRVKTQSELMK